MQRLAATLDSGAYSIAGKGVQAPVDELVSVKRLVETVRAEMETRPLP